MLFHVDVREQINDIPKALLIHFRTSEVLGKYTLQAVVLFLDKTHGLINLDAYFRSMSIGCYRFPTCFLRDPEYALACVLIFIFLHSVTLGYQLLVTLLEPV